MILHWNNPIIKALIQYMTSEFSEQTFQSAEYPQNISDICTDSKGYDKYESKRDSNADL